MSRKNRVLGRQGFLENDKHLSFNIFMKIINGMISLKEFMNLTGFNDT